MDNVQIKQRFLARRKGEGREGRGRDTVGILKGILGKERKKEKGTVPLSGGKRLEKADVFVLRSTLSRVNSASLSLLPSLAGGLRVAFSPFLQRNPGQYNGLLVPPGEEKKRPPGNWERSGKKEGKGKKQSFEQGHEAMRWKEK